ncbi:hypothetical protein BCR41DRAFT_392632 [Lobosporangium transversale]|uniref:MD-2-related lipid-recognition domain-containing protein n=1 Tax=Lobosporangium transversale TaxID=64571 RepID=A0A1Y2GYC7_9FUNG|nr:hypothetical protein BCR41DRAFT_392632 [Lobosporangium transversale]ORZ27308.1 hypothetical protein BCR41DRAFT_392632 [Lobosporangium transversale]|eukprot:XP_021885035.1 hypothetical protein BCR41DRAFT_392632 [Lobosporangium transversale]
MKGLRYRDWNSLIPITASARLNIVGKFLNHIIYTDAFDFCTVLAKFGTSCPVSTSAAQIKFCFLIKKTAPPLPILFQIPSINGNGHITFCLQATVTVVEAPPS